MNNYFNEEEVKTAFAAYVDSNRELVSSVDIRGFSNRFILFLYGLRANGPRPDVTTEDVKMTKLLEQYSELALKKSSSIDLALSALLTEFKEYLPELDNNFHKQFRQRDVTPSGCIDVAIYQLLDASDLFWVVFSKVTVEK